MPTDSERVVNDFCKAWERRNSTRSWASSPTMRSITTSRWRRPKARTRSATRSTRFCRWFERVEFKILKHRVGRQCRVQRARRYASRWATSASSCRSRASSRCTAARSPPWRDYFDLATWTARCSSEVSARHLSMASPVTHAIIGTAGHIDHGKTALIKALTGQDTDRLKEEKERGISIDLGFRLFHPARRHPRGGGRCTGPRTLHPQHAGRRARNRSGAVHDRRRRRRDAAERGASRHPASARHGARNLRDHQGRPRRFAPPGRGARGDRTARRRHAPRRRADDRGLGDIGRGPRRSARGDRTPSSTVSRRAARPGSFACRWTARS